MVIRAAAGLSVANVAALVQAGQNNGPNQYWDGPGINSSTAANDPNGVTAVGYADNSQIGYTAVVGDSFTYDTGSLDGSSADILVKYTYYGDANLDGVVNSDDLAQYLFGKSHPSQATWLNGDFNGDGVVNSDDLALYLAGKSAYQSNGPIPSAGANSIQAVPEPTTNALLIFAAAVGILLSHKKIKTFASEKKIS
jgi:hypothetical protein